MGLEIESAPAYSITGVVASASLVAYFHNITASIEDTWTLELTAGFLDNFNAGILLGPARILRQVLGEV